MRAMHEEEFVGMIGVGTMAKKVGREVVTV